MSVAARPSRPVLIYDGDCGFCRRWVGRWRRRLGERLEYLPSRSEAVRLWFPELLGDQLARSLLLIETDGRVYAGAEAVVRSWSLGPRQGWLLRLYHAVPGLGALFEASYRRIACHRHRLS